MLKTGKTFKMEYLLALTALLLLPCVSLMQTRAATEIERDRECSLTVSTESTEWTALPGWMVSTVLPE